MQVAHHMIANALGNTFNWKKTFIKNTTSFFSSFVENNKMSLFLRLGQKYTSIYL